MISPARLARKCRGWMNRHLPMMITCTEMDALLVDYLDGTLPDPQRRRLKFHIRLCADCNCFLKAYQATIALANNVHLKVVSDRLNHSTTHITAEVYSHVTQPIAQDAADLVGGLILGAPFPKSAPRQDP